MLSIGPRRRGRLLTDWRTPNQREIECGEACSTNKERESSYMWIWIQQVSKTERISDCADQWVEYHTTNTKLKTRIAGDKDTNSFCNLLLR